MSEPISELARSTFTPPIKTMFGGIFGNKKKPAPERPLSLAPGISAAISTVIGAKAIPTMPRAAQRAFELSTDPNAEARDFVAVVESDESLSARVLKIANSVFFDRGKKSSTIEEAITIIGMNEIRSLLNATTLSEIFPTRHVARTQLWSNDVATAMIARDLSNTLAPGKGDLAFLGGLMHDVGKLVLLQRVPAEYDRVLALVAQDGHSFQQAETQIFPFSHTEVGQLVAEQWSFGPELTAVIRDHHLPISEQQDGVVRAVHAADLIAHALGLGHPKQFHRVLQSAKEQLPELWPLLDIDPSTTAELLKHWQQQFELEQDLFTGKEAR